MGIMTRKRAVDNFHQQLEQAFDDGYRQYAKSENAKVEHSNIRLQRVLLAQLGADFVHQLANFKTAVGAKGALLRIVRHPAGVPVMDRRLRPAQYVWFEQKNHEWGNYIIISIQIRPDRWIQFNAHH